MNSTDWDEVWQECFDETKERSPEFDPGDYYRSGRASKAWPEKEGPDWWLENGPKFVGLWESWRDSSGLTIAEVITDVDVDTGAVTMAPAIELEVWGYNDWNNDRQEYDLQVRSVIDRVMKDDKGDLYIVDLKSGSMTPPWPLQLALNNLGLFDTYGERAAYAGFWSARKGGVEEWVPLDRFPDDWLWDQVRSAKAIRDQQLFLANPGNLCKAACGVRDYCVAVGGTPFFPVDATLTQRTKG